MAEEPPPVAEVYVINLDERGDKCRCMKKQMRSSPWPTHRFPAVTSLIVNTTCPMVVEKLLTVKDIPLTSTHLKSAALVCSNLLVWQEFLKKSRAPNLVIFEDDAIITDPDMWSRLGSFLETPCASWDYLLIDAWTSKRRMVDTLVSEEHCSQMEINNLTFHYSGSHMQVFSRKAVETLVAWFERTKTIAVMDKLMCLASHFNPFLDVYQVFANFTAQANSVPKLASGSCDESVWLQEDRRSLLRAPPNTWPIMDQSWWGC